MSLESGTYISDLNTSNPTAGDPKSQGDDHLRLLKTTLKNTLPNVTGAITGTHTEINDAVQRVLTSGTSQASTSGTSIDFTSIPSWVKRVTISFSGVSTSGTNNILVQVGDSGGVETSGYLGIGGDVLNAGGVSNANNTSGFLVVAGASTSVLHGSIVLTLIDASSFTWAASGVTGRSDIARLGWTAGSKSLSATLDRVRITTVGGTDTFDAGKINVLYE